MCSENFKQWPQLFNEICYLMEIKSVLNKKIVLWIKIIAFITKHENH
jgi:hypothetical protein